MGADHDSDLVRARIVAGQGASFRAQGVTVYERNKGAIQRIVDAEQAVPEGPRVGGSPMSTSTIRR